MIDKSSLPLKYWGMGKWLFLGEEDDIEFSTAEDMHKAIQAIEYIDELNGGIRHESRQ